MDSDFSIAHGSAQYCAVMTQFSQLVAITERGQTSGRSVADTLKTRTAGFLVWGERDRRGLAPLITGPFLRSECGKRCLPEDTFAFLDQFCCQGRFSIIIAFDEHCVKLRSHCNALKFKYSQLA